MLLFFRLQPLSSIVDASFVAERCFSTEHSMCTSSNCPIYGILRCFRYGRVFYLRQANYMSMQLHLPFPSMCWFALVSLVFFWTQCDPCKEEGKQTPAKGSLCVPVKSRDILQLTTITMSCKPEEKSVRNWHLPSYEKDLVRRWSGP